MRGDCGLRTPAILVCLDESVLRCWRAWTAICAYDADCSETCSWGAVSILRVINELGFVAGAVRGRGRGLDRVDGLWRWHSPTR